MYDHNVKFLKYFVDDFAQRWMIYGWSMYVEYNVLCECLFWIYMPESTIDKFV